MTDLAFIVGDRVEHALIGCQGTVEYVAPDNSLLRVMWDDGKLGLIYNEGRMLPNVRFLIRLSNRP
jgi:hypothetical protein